jgi:hypothetical protein
LTAAPSAAPRDLYERRAVYIGGGVILLILIILLLVWIF